MTADVKDLVERLASRPGDIGGPSYMQMLREREEAASAIKAQAAEIERMKKALATERYAADNLRSASIRCGNALNESRPRVEAAERDRDALKEEVAAKDFALRNGKSLSEAAIEAIRHVLTEAGVEPAAFVDDHVRNLVVERDALKEEVERLRVALQGLLTRAAEPGEEYGPEHAVTVARAALNHEGEQ